MTGSRDRVASIHSDMPQPFYFGNPDRPLLGLRHAPATTARAAILLCAPLLQDGIRCQRALWSLAESLAAAGVETLRFDWHGSGDSPGDSRDLRAEGLVDDVAAAAAFLAASMPGRARWLALREAALPLLAHAGRAGVPVDVVLWDPVLDGRALVARWRRQHGQQLHAAGRFLSKDVDCGGDELLGFVLDPALSAGLAGCDGTRVVLPAGSRLAIAHWPHSPLDEAFVARQRAAGVEVEMIALDAADAPDWDDPGQFELQWFPRRAVNRLAARLAAAA